MRKNNDVALPTNLAVDLENAKNDSGAVTFIEKVGMIRVLGINGLQEVSRSVDGGDDSTNTGDGESDVEGQVGEGEEEAAVVLYEADVREGNMLLDIQPLAIVGEQERNPPVSTKWVI
jgi:hypothetical protein